MPVFFCAVCFSEVAVPQRWHAHHHSSGTGPLYQGRFKSFPIQQDGHLLTVCRCVERNALRANMVKSAQRWPWCSLAARGQKQRPAWLLPLKQWPVEPPVSWKAWVNRSETAAELEALRSCVKRGRPYGDERWEKRTARQLGLESTLNPQARPRVRRIKDSRP
jgi:putative transposase